MTSFMIGVNIGSKVKDQKDGFINEDREKINILSRNEEYVQKVSEEANLAPKKNKKMMDNTDSSAGSNTDDAYKKIQEEFNKLDSLGTKTKGVENVKKKNTEVKSEPTPKTLPAPVVDVATEENDPMDLKGKFTIQIGSFPNEADAISFAEGFRLRGYNPIFRKANLKDKGTRYRVSLGVFSQISEAKQYILEEKSLFEGQDHAIMPFDSQ